MRGAHLATEDVHYYEPARGHGLRHDPFNAIIAPRPIGWISTCSRGGRFNLAPYSFFNAFSYRPPTIGFSSIGHKDTLKNVLQTNEFVFNLATRRQAEAMNLTSVPFPHGVNEFEAAGLRLSLRGWSSRLAWPKLRQHWSANSFWFSRSRISTV